MTLSIWHPRRLAAALAALCLAALPAGPGAAGAFEDLAPCLTTQQSLDGLTAAFMDAGWSPIATDAERTRAAAATAEINWALRTSPGRFRSAEQAAAFLESAHRSHDKRTDPYVLLQRDGRVLILEWSTNGHRGQNICLMAAAEIDYVRAAIPDNTGARTDRAFMSVEPRLMAAPSNIRRVQAILARLQVPEAARDLLAGGQGVVISATYKWE